MNCFCDESRVYLYMFKIMFINIKGQNYMTYKPDQPMVVTNNSGKAFSSSLSEPISSN